MCTKVLFLGAHLFIFLSLLTPRVVPSHHINKAKHTSKGEQEHGSEERLHFFHDDLTMPSSEDNNEATEREAHIKVACRIPHLDPFESKKVLKSIKDFYSKPSSFNCEEDFPLLFGYTLNSTIYVLKPVETFKKMGYGPCCYHSMVRKPNDDDDYTLSDICYPIRFDTATRIPSNHEFIMISCKYRNNTKIFQSSPETKVVDMHSFVHFKSDVEQRIKRMGKTDETGVNVVIFGIDATSHMNFIRIFPESYAYMMNNLSAVDINGYNKVGSNTFPNMGAVLTSLPSPIDHFLPCQVDLTFDKCPFIWQKYSRQGYRTSFGEDAPYIGMLNYLTTGFRHQPVDYYFRTFAVGAEEKITSHSLGNTDGCYGPRLQFQTLLDYTQKMAYTMGFDKRYFQLLWSTSLTHDDLNQGGLGDQPLLTTIKWLHTGGYLNNTVFILMSDHGILYGDIWDTPQGKLEERLPLLLISVPNWFKKKFLRAYANLKRNANRLSTPYDLHETLSDLAHLGQLTQPMLGLREQALKMGVNASSLPRGISHFLPIPPSRTCHMAGVGDHFCTCHHSQQVDIEDPTVKKVAAFGVEAINKKVGNYSDCALLSLASIIGAQKLTIETDFSKDSGYLVSFTTSPGGASFDATVKKVNGKWKLAGPISRTNMYGKQSHCVIEKHLKPYCYCIDLL